MKINPIPAGDHSVTPYLIIKGAARALDFYQRAFGATKLMRIPVPGDQIGHAEILLGDSHIMLANERPQTNDFSPQTLGGSPVPRHLYVPADAMFAQAIAAGASIEAPMEKNFMATVLAPCWTPLRPPLAAVHARRRGVAGGNRAARLAAMGKPA